MPHLFGPIMRAWFRHQLACRASRELCRGRGQAGPPGSDGGFVGRTY